MTTEEQIAAVINMANQIELSMKLILGTCLSPTLPDFGFLRELILHNTVTSFSAKHKMLTQLCAYFGWKEEKKSLSDLHDLMRLRNAFAHTPTNSRMLEVLQEDESTPGIVIGNYMVIESVTTAGEVQRIKRSEAFESFKTIHGKIVTLLDTLRKKVEARIAQP